MSFKIYTKTGDAGTTSLIGGVKVLKSADRIEAYGSVDELNAHIGLCKDSLANEEINAQLLEVQDRLFTIGSSLACAPEIEVKMAIPDIIEADIVALEGWIDRMEMELSPMKSFILPGGHAHISFIHIARTVCRRSERAVVRLTETGDLVDAIIIKYLNRLSDYLFVLSRYVGFLLGISDIPWLARVTGAK